MSNIHVLNFSSPHVCFAVERENGALYMAERDAPSSRPGFLTTNAAG